VAALTADLADRDLALADATADVEAARAEARSVAAELADVKAEAKAAYLGLQAELAAARSAAPAGPSDPATDAHRQELEDDLLVARADLDRARADVAAARDERDRARSEIGGVREDAKAARAERDRLRTTIHDLEARLEAAAAEAPPLAPDDVVALVALVESVEAERDALAAELAALRAGEPANSVTPPA
jgi:uncharacterized protein (DUF3084 family)